MTELFGRDQSVISCHIAKAIKDEEITKKCILQIQAVWWLFVT